jgi:hypothetical protein
MLLFAVTLVIIAVLGLDCLLLQVSELLNESEEFVFGEEVSVNQLVAGSAAALKEPVVLITSRSWVDASEVHVFVSLHFIEGLEHQLTVLGTDSRQSLEEILVDISLSQKTGKRIAFAL